MKENRVLTVIQARTGSIRLPNKVLMPICEKPLLVRMVERVQFAKTAGKIVVATSIKSEDDVIENLCVKEGIECFRGHPIDLLDRHYRVAEEYEADSIVKIPSDCPLIDPGVIDDVISFYLDNQDKYDYVSNIHPATFPDGNDVEIMSFAALEKSWNEANRNLEREHTTPYIWENPNKFRIGNVVWKTGKNLSASHRWTIDYEEDYIFIKTIYEELYENNPHFGLDDILKLLKEKPHIEKINSKYAGRYWYENHLNELRNIDEYKNRLDK